MSKWEKVVWPFSDNVKEDVFSMKIKRGKVYLRDNPGQSYPFTVNCGASSDRSFSGCFYNMGVTSLQQAMDLLEKRTF